NLNLELGDIIEPNPIVFSFNTMGWKVVFALLTFLLVYILYRIYLAYKKRQYLRDAVINIQKLNSETNSSSIQFINAVLFILKDTAMKSFGRREVAALHGKGWLEFLDDKVSQS